MTAQTVYPVDIVPGGTWGVRAFVVTGETPFIVDTGIHDGAPKILAELQRLSIDPRDIALIVITHAHPDHTGSLAEMITATGAPVLAQSLDAAAMKVGAAEPVVGRTPAAKEFAAARAAEAAERSGPAYPPYAPDYVAAEERDLSDLGIDARVIHTPGHTAGGLSVVLGNGEVIVGDIIGSEDGKPSLARFATDEIAMAESIRRVLALEPSVVHTCHDGSFEFAQLAVAFG